MITIQYPIRPKTRSLLANQVCDLYGIGMDEPPVTIAENFALELDPGEIALFHGPSGSGKSSLLRAVGKEMDAFDANELELPKCSLVEAFDGPLEERLGWLSACGLAEARLMLREPDELSEGQRFRFRLAYALKQSRTILVDEFAALLDRPLAKLLAFNLRKQATRTGARLLLATTHDDIIGDLQPDVRIECREGEQRVTRVPPLRKPISFHADLTMEEGTRADWPPFAKWHYRGHGLGFVKRVVLLKHGPKPVGICVFGSPAASLALRTKYFGLQRPRSASSMQRINASLWLLSRVVLDPVYRGAGIAAGFVARACDSCPVPWIETLTAMGRVNPFFEKAGFERVGVIRKTGTGGAGGAYGRRMKKAPSERGRYSAPVYYIRRTHQSRSMSSVGIIGNVGTTLSAPLGVCGPSPPPPPDDTRTAVSSISLPVSASIRTSGPPATARMRK